MAVTMHSPSNVVLRARATVTARVLLRVTGAVLGSYIACAALVALVAVGLAALGLTRSEAVVTASLLGFVFYLLVVLWAFSVRKLAWLWACLAGGTALAYGLMLAIQRLMA